LSEIQAVITQLRLIIILFW